MLLLVWSTYWLYVGSGGEPGIGGGGGGAEKLSKVCSNRAKRSAVFLFISRKYFEKFLTDTLAKMSQNIVAYSFVQKYKHFFYVEKKTCILKRSTPFS